MDRIGMYCTEGSSVKLAATIAVACILITSLASVDGAKTVDTGGCNITWFTDKGANAARGQQLANCSAATVAVGAGCYKTAESCQDYCVDLPSCVAVEFDVNTGYGNFGCWVHTNQSDLVELFNAGPNVTHYMITRACVPPPATTRSSNNVLPAGYDSASTSLVSVRNTELFTISLAVAMTSLVALFRQH